MSYQVIKRHGGNIYVVPKGKKVIWEGYIHPGKKQNNGDKWKDKVVARNSGGKIEPWIGGAQGIFRAVKLFCMTL